MKMIVYESFQHFIPTGNGWINGFSSLGWTSYKLPSLEYKITDIDEEVDLLIVHDLTESLALDIIKYKNLHPKSKVAVLCSTFEPFFESIKDYVDLWFNLSLKNTYLSNIFAEKNMKLECISLAGYLSLSYPIISDKIYDVSFIGQIGHHGHGYREEDKYLFPVIDRGYNGFYGGFSYKKKTWSSIPYTELNNIYNKTKVNLNFHYKNQKVESVDPESRIELNGRIFDIALSGNFQITDNPVVSELFGDSIPFVKSSEWLDTIDFFIHNKEKRIALSNLARKICLEKHTYKNRVEQIVSLLNL